MTRSAFSISVCGRSKPLPRTPQEQKYGTNPSIPIPKQWAAQRWRYRLALAGSSGPARTSASGHMASRNSRRRSQDMQGSGIPNLEGDPLSESWAIKFHTKFLKNEIKKGPIHLTNFVFLPPPPRPCPSPHKSSHYLINMPDPPLGCLLFPFPSI